MPANELKPCRVCKRDDELLIIAMEKIQAYAEKMLRGGEHG